MDLCSKRDLSLFSGPGWGVLEGGRPVWRSWPEEDLHSGREGAVYLHLCTLFIILSPSLIPTLLPSNIFTFNTADVCMYSTYFIPFFSFFFWTVFTRGAVCLLQKKKRRFFIEMLNNKCRPGWSYEAVFRRNKTVKHLLVPVLAFTWLC